MKNFTLSILCLILSYSTFSQCDTNRYKHAIFNDVTVHEDIKYGEGQVWNIPYNNTDLYMDIYEPTNDTVSKRPLMIWVHPGGFLTGEKEAEDMVALCDSFARRGYVTVSIDYRKGFNPLSTNSAERAVYRGTQDARSAIRFLKEYSNDYGIDTNFTFIGGSSAGGFSALHTAYLEQHEAPSSITGSFGVPNLGDLDDSGNPYNHDMNLTGIVNLWGALGDSNWVSSHETVPALLVHGTTDGTVPYGVGHPFGVFTTPITHGSRSISNQLDFHGIAHETLIFPGEGHEPHGTSNGDFEGNPPTPYWDTIFEAVRDHYFKPLKPNNVIINGNTSVCLNDTVTYTFTNGVSFCYSGTNMTVINDDGNSIDVVFTETGNQTLEVVNYNSIRANGEPQVISVEVNPLPDASFTMGVDELCLNESTILSPNESGGVFMGNGTIDNEFMASNAGVGIHSITYSANDGTCSSQSSQTIEVLDLPITTTDFTDGVLSSLENDPNATYQWVRCGSFEPIAEANEQFFEVPENGNYAIIIDNGTCVDTSDCIEVNSLSSNDYFLDDSFLLYPNPNDGAFQLEWSLQLKGDIEIIDNQGRIIFKDEFESSMSSKNINLNLEPGSYTVLMKFENGELGRKSLIVGN